MFRKCFFVFGALFFSGCAGQLACKSHLEEPHGFTSKILLVGCGDGGDIRPGLTISRGFVLQKDSDGNEYVSSLDTGFASEGSTKNLGLGIVNTGVQGGLQAVTAGQFKPNKYNSNISVSGSQNQSPELNQNTETNQLQGGQQQVQEQVAKTAASSSSSSNAENHNDNNNQPNSNNSRKYERGRPKMKGWGK